jgi:tetratricopeptide (TPR) repeat protein
VGKTAFFQRRSGNLHRPQGSAMRMLLCLLVTITATTAQAVDAAPLKAIDDPPYHFETDVQDTALCKKVLGNLKETSQFFIKVYNLKENCFQQYADFWAQNNAKYEKLIRVKFFRKYDKFLEDFQKRYDTKSIPAAYFGINKLKDEYGKESDTWIREIATCAEGSTYEQILREYYHEMGHLFMRTFITYPNEIPSWMEEGTAQLFQLRKGNGTKPEADRDERSAWMVEMIDEGAAIPWPEFINVRNLDNLDFTWKDPLRSTIQYTQAWQVMEFVIASPQRQQAYNKFLTKLKDAARDECAAAAGLQGQAYHDRIRNSLYPRQEKLFKDCYGADLVSVEGKWKEWVKSNYEKGVTANPVLRYHRGVWHVGLRANYAKSPEQREQELVKGEKIFQECVSLTPKMPEGYVGMGRVAMMRGDMKAAGEFFAKALELGADNFETLLYGSIAQIYGGKAKDAVAALEKAVEQRPTNYEVNYYLGLALGMSDGDVEKALAHLRTARDLKQDMVATCALVEGLIQYRAGKLNDAYISFLRASNVQQNNPIILPLMAIAKLASNDAEEAKDILSRAEKAGNPIAARVAALIAEGKTPKPVFTRRGHPAIAGVTVPEDGEPSGDGEESKAGDAFQE